VYNNTSMADSDFLSLPSGVSGEDFIGAGNSGICFRYPGTNRVIKIPLDDGDEKDRCQIEAIIYERLREIPNRPATILQYYGRTEHGIDLEYALHGSIRQYRANGGTFPPELLYRWANQASEALAFCNSNNIFHSDISCRNFFLLESLDLVLADFAGASIDGRKPLVYYSISHRKQPGCSDSSLIATEQTEIFAFGSFLYELITGNEPHLTHEEQHQIFPDVSSLPLGTVISGCWNGHFHQMDHVRTQIQLDSRSSDKKTISDSISALFKLKGNLLAYYLPNNTKATILYPSNKVLLAFSLSVLAASLLYNRVLR